MKQHLSNTNSPKTILQVTNPGYTSPEEITRLRKLEDEGRLQAETFITSVDAMLADSKALYGDSIHNPTYPIELDSRSYCGVLLKRTPQPAPLFLWTSHNYIMARSLLNYPPEEICWDCVSHLDAIRDKQGHRPALEHLRNPDDCDCAMWVLQRHGCKCEEKL